MSSLDVGRFKDDGPLLQEDRDAQAGGGMVVDKFLSLDVVMQAPVEGWV